jgi:hypothetical protein
MKRQKLENKRIDAEEKAAKEAALKAKTDSTKPATQPAE